LNEYANLSLEELRLKNEEAWDVITTVAANMKPNLSDSITMGIRHSKLHFLLASYTLAPGMFMLVAFYKLSFC